LWHLKLHARLHFLEARLCGISRGACGHSGNSGSGLVDSLLEPSSATLACKELPSLLTRRVGKGISIDLLESVES
jgi:hypothetical protein